LWKYAKPSKTLKNAWNIAKKTKTNFILQIKKVEIKNKKQIGDKK